MNLCNKYSLSIYSPTNGPNEGKKLWHLSDGIDLNKDRIVGYLYTENPNFNDADLLNEIGVSVVKMDS